MFGLTKRTAGVLVESLDGVYRPLKEVLRPGFRAVFVYENRVKNPRGSYLLTVREVKKEIAAIAYLPPGAKYYNIKESIDKDGSRVVRFYG